MSQPVKWALAFFVFHVLLYLIFIHGEPVTGITPEGRLGVFIIVLEFWWVLPVSLVTLPLTEFVSFKELFFFSLWSDYWFAVLVLAGSSFYAILGYFFGLTRVPDEQDQT
ncbi:MAG: hypothetical protein ABEK50_03425 [bacterium]